MTDNSAGSAREDLPQEIPNASIAPMAIQVLEDGPLVNPELAPRSQLDFVGWVYENYERIYGREVRPVGAKPIKAPRVPGLAVYACEAFGGHYYAAWSDYNGKFIGWLWYGPKISQMDNEYAVGRVLGRPVFWDMNQNTIRRHSIQTWREALVEAAMGLEAV